MSTVLMQREGRAVLQLLLGGLDVDRFIDEHWAASHLHVRGPVDRYDHIMTPARFEELVAAAEPSLGQVREVRGGVRAPYPVHSGNLRQVFEEGYTLILSHINQRDLRVHQVRRQLELALGMTVWINGYLTPANATGLPPHNDPHDVIVLQLAGRKCWQIRRPSVPDGDHRAGPYNVGGAPLPELVAEIEVGPGDLLYVPRYWVHAASATDTTSLHLTIGLDDITCESIVIGAARRVIGRSRVMSRCLGPGGLWHDDVPAALVDAVANELGPSLAAALVDELRAKRAGFLRERNIGSLGIQSSTRSQATALRRCAGITYGLNQEGARWCLQFGSRQMRFPEVYGPALAHVVTAAEIDESALLAGLLPAQRATLMESLIDGGALEPAP